TLDGQERPLTDAMLMIADETKAVALAGIMGGLNSEIQEQTADVLIESACFKPQSIRMTSRRLELKSDASYRFERGSDVGICDWASQRAAQLIIQTAGGRLAPGVVDAYPGNAVSRRITLRFDRTNQLLGVSIPANEQTEYLKRLELRPVPETELPAQTEGADASRATFQIPTFRVDLKREVDLIEEVGRLFGVDRIPPTLALGTVGSNEYDRIHDQLSEARRLLISLGLCEAQGQTLVPQQAASLATPASVALQNPLSGDMDVLRPSLLPGLLDSLQHNLNRKNQDVALFEIGRVFAPDPEGPKEKRRLAIVLTGRRQPQFWSGEDRNATMDIFDLKGLLEVFFDQFGAKGLLWEKQTAESALFAEWAVLRWGKDKAGEVGQLTPKLARQYDLRDAGFLAELDLDLLMARRNASRQLKPLPPHPSIRRDAALLAPESLLHESVLAAVKKAKPQSLEQVDLFDVFRGKNVPAGQKSLAYAFVYRHSERTLTDAEVNQTHQRLMEALQKTLGVTVRES
ncbi:MAG TPA: phenylalanine--tRNA ligase subunit beta, partial [Candidatus Paceibacterota bacterium]|nr:phenylalanine--tRNA ligase subunit beta [Candidatus Paceibacterota bacterium]